MRKFHLVKKWFYWVYSGVLHVNCLWSIFPQHSLWGISTIHTLLSCEIIFCFHLMFWCHFIWLCENKIIEINTIWSLWSVILFLSTQRLINVIFALVLHNKGKSFTSPLVFKTWLIEKSFWPIFKCSYDQVPISWQLL